MARGPQLPRNRDEERREPARGDAASHGRRPVDADCSRQRLSDTTCRALQCGPTWSGRLLGPPIRGEQLQVLVLLVLPPRDEIESPTKNTCCRHSDTWLAFTLLGPPVAHGGVVATPS